MALGEALLRLGGLCGGPLDGAALAAGGLRPGGSYPRGAGRQRALLNRPAAFFSVSAVKVVASFIIFIFNFFFF